MINQYIRDGLFSLEELSVLDNQKAYLLKINNPINYDIFEKLLSYTNSKKRGRILRQQKKEKKDTMLVAEILLGYILKKNYGIKSENLSLDYNPDGKPYLKDYTDIHFNISHSGTYVACIVADRPVGIDIQKIKEYNKNAAKRICNKEELVELEKCHDKSSEYIKLWTKKEAVLKMLGTGISTAKIKDCLKTQKVYSTKTDDYWLSICMSK